MKNCLISRLRFGFFLGTPNLAQGGNAQSTIQTASGAPQPVEEQGEGLSVGEVKDWDEAWWALVKSHNSKPLLRGHYPDEYC